MSEVDISAHSADFMAVIVGTFTQFRSYTGFGLLANSRLLAWSTPALPFLIPKVGPHFTWRLFFQKEVEGRYGFDVG